MSDPIEIIASNGDRYVGRKCDGDDNRVVIEQWFDRPPELPPAQTPDWDVEIPIQILKDIAEHFSGKP